LSIANKRFFRSRTNVNANKMISVFDKSPSTNFPHCSFRMHQVNILIPTMIDLF